MLLCRSIGGINLHWRKRTSDEDLALSVQVLAEGTARIITG